MRVRFLLAAATAATCVSSVALGDWTVTVLEIEGSQGFPRVNAVWGDRQAGSIDPGLQQPTIWLGAPGTSFQVVLPQSSDGAQINALTQTTAVGDGYAPDFGGYVAMVWNLDGTSVDVIQAPAGFDGVFAHGAAGNQQVGVAENSNFGAQAPSLWTGSTASFVNLLPAGFDSGKAFATDGVQQVGSVNAAPDYYDVAALWTGTAGSFVNLGPGGAWMFSEARGVSDGVQVGYVSDDEVTYAVAWQGTAASMFLLHPSHVPTVVASEANAIDGTVVCGTISELTSEGQTSRAAVWTSLDPLSYVNLHELLGPGYYNSEATAVWVGDNGTIRVVGNAVLDGTFQNVGVLWTLDSCSFGITAPASATSLTGDLDGNLIADACEPIVPEEDCDNNGVRDSNQTLVFTNETFENGAGDWSINGAASVHTGYVELTPSDFSQGGTAIRGPLTTGPTQRLRAIFDFRVDLHQPIPADGFSFTLFDATMIGTDAIFGEDGIDLPDVVSVKFNTFENFAGEGSNSMYISYGGSVVAGNTDLPLEIADENWHRAVIDLTPEGIITVRVGTVAGDMELVFDDVQLPSYQPRRNNIGFGGRAGGFASRHSIANVRLGVNGPNDIDGDGVLDSCASTCASCPADYDNNGGVDGGDLAVFFADFEAGEGCADVDHNGGVDGGDLAFFFFLFEAGGC